MPSTLGVKYARYSTVWSYNICEFFIYNKIAKQFEGNNKKETEKYSDPKEYHRKKGKFRQTIKHSRKSD